MNGSNTAPIPDDDFSALILAGGQGRRFGGDKKKIVVAGKYLIERQIEFLKNIFTNIIVSSNNEFKYSGITVVHDSIGAGPLAGMYSAFKVCKTRYLYVCACDMPYLSADFIRKLKNALPADAVVYKRVEDGEVFLEPFNAIYSCAVAGIAQEQLKRGIYKMSEFLKRIHTAALDLPDAENLFYNINYPNDLIKINHERKEEIRDER